MPCDLVIRNGTVIDGSGLPRYRAADLVVFDPDTIAAEMPEVVDDLPAGALPGQLLRGPLARRH